jgi:tetratricopeptide (TPR) repeat protein
LELAQQRTDDALAHLREAATRESATEKSATTPGPLAPARESLGDLLLALGRSKEALAEYRETLKTEPNRYRALEGAMQAAKASGERRAEANYRAQLNTLTGK